MAEYPEHEKLAAVKDEAQAIGEFLDTAGYILARWDPAEAACIPVSEGITSILAQYFGIDEAALESEKRRMLAALRG